jgi:hypothetical protein
MGHTHQNHVPLCVCTSCWSADAIAVGALGAVVPDVRSERHKTQIEIQVLAGIGRLGKPPNTSVSVAHQIGLASVIPNSSGV